MNWAKTSLKHGSDSQSENNGILFSEGQPYFNYQMLGGGIPVAAPSFLSSHISALTTALQGGSRALEPTVFSAVPCPN